MKKLSFYFLSMVLLLVGCKSNNSKKSIDQTEKPQKDLIVYTLKDEKSFDKQMMEIDSFVLAYGKFASSLDYGKEDKTTIHVDAHLDNEENIVKLVENFTDKDATSMGTNFFYLHDGKVFMSKEIFVTNKSADFIERISYYAPNGICLKSKERKAVSEVSLLKAKFEAVPKTVCSIDRAMRALNQEKEFATTFQGFIQSGKDAYMIVGTPGTGGYTSALKITKEDKFIAEIRKDELRYLNGTIYLQFEKIEEVGGFTYQSLIKGSWTKEAL
jgi:hypothetical protein